jgi:uncharacterized damage-inducible protein DinB
MQMDQHFFRNHFAYSRHATNKLLDACQAVGVEELTRHNFTPFKNLLGTLLHIFQADRIWLERVQGIRAPFFREGDDKLTLQLLGQAWNALFDAWDEWVASTDDFDRQLVFHSVLLQKDLEAPLSQVLLHVVNHASYHRGQVSMLLRQLGHTSATNDLIFYVVEREEAARSLGV